MRSSFLACAVVLVLGVIVFSCGSGDGGAGGGIVCGGTRCAASVTTCCNNCGTEGCECLGIACPGDAAFQCGATSCSGAEVCCTGCNGEQSCSIGGCPAIMCPKDSGSDAPDSSTEAGEAGRD